MYKIGGLDGTRAVKMSDISVPASIANVPQFGNRKVRNTHDWLKPLPQPSSVTLLNRGGQRGVLPCFEAVNYSRVIRRAPGNKFTGLYPQQGYARSQPLGLAFQKEKPTNLPIMSLPSSVNGALNSKIRGRY